MKKEIINISLALAALSMSAVATAQNTASGYFIDNYTYRFEMNPAMGNDANFVATPAMGNLNVAMNGTLHLTDVLYSRGGRTVTFLNPNVTVDDAMSNIERNNRIGTDLKINLLAGGFKAWGGYNAIAVNARMNANINVPKAVFSLLKEGVSNQDYNISDLRATANAYSEVLLGHSRPIGKEWRVGANMKFLIGAANFDAHLKSAHLNLSPEGWDVTTNAVVNANVKGFKYKTKYDEGTHSMYVDGADVSGSGLNGFGMAWDFGAVYAPAALPDWKFSAAILDLGFITWSNNVEASTNGDVTFSTNRYTFNADDDATNSFKNEWSDISDDLSTLYHLTDNGDKGSQTRALGATMNLGVEYSLPTYKAMKFGLLNTTRIQGQFSWTDFRLSANYLPTKVIGLGANLGVGTFGCSFGWMVSLAAGPFNMFAGMDHTPGKLAKQGVPLSSNASFNLGMNWLF